MAIIYSYPHAVPAINDMVLGTKFRENEGISTNSFYISDIVTLVQEQSGSGGLDIETYQIFITSLTASLMPSAPSSINNIFRGTNSTLIGAGGSMDNVSVIKLSDGSLLTSITSSGAVPV